MEEQKEKRQCSICGDPLKEEHPGALCDYCTDAWEREVECNW